MSPHFRAFTFVDRITSLDNGNRVRGEYTVPAGLDSFPLSLASEAVGQLAAWKAMAVVDFKSRPLAGIAECVEFLSTVRPGQKLQLSVEFASIDSDAVGYDGLATADGIEVVRLRHCVGPMVPMIEYDDPEAARERLSLLQGPGAEPGGFRGLPPFLITPAAEAGNGVLRGSLQVPAEAVFFEDHFPRRPLFPGSLLMHLNLQFAARMAGAAATNGRGWKPTMIRDVKLRAFIPPGSTLDIQAQLEEASDDTTTVAVETRNGKRLLASARAEFSRENVP